MSLKTARTHIEKKKKRKRKKERKKPDKTMTDRNANNKKTKLSISTNNSKLLAFFGGVTKANKSSIERQTTLILLSKKCVRILNQR